MPIDPPTSPVPGVIPESPHLAPDGVVTHEQPPPPVTSHTPAPSSATDRGGPASGMLAKVLGLVHERRDR